jgi:hypothetical protein
MTTGQPPNSTARHHTLLGTLTALLAGTAIALLTTTPATADPTTTAWAQLRNCESGDNYTSASANGYYGAYQFNLTTWRSVGGTGTPSKATPAEQNYRALYLYRMRGWQPWGCAHNLHLPPDTDAATKHTPTRADATYMNNQHTTTSHTTAPAWPGKIYTYGDCAPGLRTFQLHMNAYGYHFEGTGCYYAKTKTAVIAVQRANHLTVDAQLGPKTWQAAWHGTPPKH